MRVISGKYGGRRFPSKAPLGVRPTTDMVKEALFNTLGNLTDINGLKILDLFAGTGALGIECLSRGADSCVFVEKNRNIVASIEEFAISIGIEKKCFRIVNNDVAKALEKILIELRLIPFDIVFLDPPYNLNINNRIIDLISKNKIVSNGGYVVSELSSIQSILIPNGFELIKEKVFGETKFVILKNIVKSD